MDKAQLIKSLSQSPEDEMVLASFWDKAQLCDRKNIVTNTKFLSPAQKNLCLALSKNAKIYNFGFYGIAEDAERSVAIFYPDYLDFDGAKEEVLSLLRCTKSQRDTLGHRDYLGSLMGLGIVREVIGDIFVHEKGADIVVLSEMKDFLLMNFQKAGRKELSIEEISPSELITNESTGQEINQSVSSLRLDCIVSSVFNISRGVSQELISSGRVFLNGLECKKSDKEIKEGDKINIRGRGKVIFNEVTGLSKKGKLRISACKFV